MKHRSFFWPFVLIATGAVWLLIELRTIPVENLWALAYIWPFFLLVVGVGLVLRSFWPILRPIVSGLVILGIVLAILFAPQLNWNRPPAWSVVHGISLGGSVRGSGVVTTQTRNVADFDSIEVDFPAEITVQQGTATSVTVEAEDNLQPQLNTRVSGGCLYIEDTMPAWNMRVNPTRTVHINITVPDLKQVDFPSAGSLTVNGLQTEALRISISGAGSVDLSDLKVKRLTVDLSGAGNVSADGSADDLQMDISGLGGFQGDSLASQTVDVTISGAGSATVWASRSLNADISGTGSVSYYGSPSVQKNISGLGSVTGLGNK